MSKPLMPNPDAIAHDFEAFLRYVVEEKVVLTPKQKLIPLRHIKQMMEDFQVKEEHEHRIGDSAYKKRDELEYTRFYFLDLLALGGGFLRVSRNNVLSKGPHWNTFFSVPLEEKGFFLVCEFWRSFNLDNWLLRGGDFGEQLESNSEMVLSHMASWSDGRLVDWKLWAKQVIRACGFRWNSEDQTFAEDLAIWGLEHCFFKPLEYFGLVEARKEGKSFARLHSFRLNQTGQAYFSRLFATSNKSIKDIPPFSLN